MKKFLWIIILLLGTMLFLTGCDEDFLLCSEVESSTNIRATEVVIGYRLEDKYRNEYWTELIDILTEE